MYGQKRRKLLRLRAAKNTEQKTKLVPGAVKVRASKVFDVESPCGGVRCRLRAGANVFRDYRLRVAKVIRDYGKLDRAQAPVDTLPNVASGRL
jgi:hypothetical protein